jgi:putative FmdB family regulatory protein
MAVPIYAYRCESCGYAQDVLQKISDPLLTLCPACGAATFSKQITAAGFQLKGTGWYVTDFRGGAKAASGTTPSNNEKTGDASATPDTGGSKPAESSSTTGTGDAAPATGSGADSKQ